MPAYPTIEPALHRRAVLWLMAGTAAWGLSFPVQKMLTMLQQDLVPAAGTWFLTSWIICLRSLMAAAVLLLWKPQLLRGMTGEEVRQADLLYSTATALCKRAEFVADEATQEPRYWPFLIPSQARRGCPITTLLPNGPAEPAVAGVR